jgi:hypothetical protein
LQFGKDLVQQKEGKEAKAAEGCEEKQRRYHTFFVAHIRPLVK